MKKELILGKLGVVITENTVLNTKSVQFTSVKNAWTSWIDTGYKQISYMYGVSTDNAKSFTAIYQGSPYAISQSGSGLSLEINGGKFRVYYDATRTFNVTVAGTKVIQEEQ